MLNFKAIYNAVLNKLAQEARESNSKKGFSILEKKIINTPALTKQYQIYSTLTESKRGLSEDEAQNLVLFVERYCSKLNYAELDKANRDLIKFFNIDAKSVPTLAIDEAIDDLIRFTTGGTVLLTEGTKYRKALLEHLTTSAPAVTTEVKNPFFEAVNPEVVLEAMTHSVDKSYNALTRSEKDIVEIVRSNNKTKVETKLRVVESMAKRIVKKDQKEMITSCATALRERLKTEDASKVVYETYTLRANAISLLEDQFGGGFSKKLKDLKYIKNIQFGCFDDRDKPETVIIRFTVYLYPLAATYMDYNRASKDLDRRMHRISRNVINQTIFKADSPAKQFFTGEGIWDSSVRSEGLRPGQPTPGHVEWNLYAIQPEGAVRNIEAFQVPVYHILQQLDQLIPTWIQEVDPKAQQDYIAMLNEPTEKGAPASDNDDAEEKDHWYSDDPDDKANAHEPNASDIKGAEKDVLGRDAADDDDDELV